MEVGFVCVLKSEDGQQGQNKSRPNSAAPRFCAYRAWVGDISIASFASYQFATKQGHVARKPVVVAPAAATRLRWRPPRCTSLRCTRLQWHVCPDTGTDLLSFTLSWNFSSKCSDMEGSDHTVQARGTAAGTHSVSTMRCAGVVAVDVWLIMSVSRPLCASPDHARGLMHQSWIGRARVPCFCIEQLRLPVVQHASSVTVALQPIGLLGQHEPLSETTCATMKLTKS